LVVKEPTSAPEWRRFQIKKATELPLNGPEALAMARRIALWAACASLLFPIVSCSGSDHGTLFMPSGSGGASGGGGSTSSTATSTTTTSAGGASDTTGATGGTDPTGTGGATVGSGGALGGSGGTSATGGSAGVAVDAGSGVCLANTDCPSGQYCKKSGCLSTTTQGRCAVRPASCDPAESVVCGCDGFTYFNSCLAEQSGQNLRTHDPCVDSAVRCMSNSDPACGMGKNAYCAFLLPDQRSCAIDNLRGRCWVIPETCPQTIDHYDACGGPEKCLHACDAIKTEKPMFRNTVCD
jgi:hypothetical protein